MILYDNERSLLQHIVSGVVTVPFVISSFILLFLSGVFIWEVIEIAMENGLLKTITILSPTIIKVFEVFVFGVIYIFLFVWSKGTIRKS